MGEKSSGRIAGGAGAVAALAAVGVLFAGAGLVGDGLGSFDLWPDWTGSARPAVEVAARSPDGPGVNPLLPLIPRTQGFRALGSATAALVVAPTAFSAGADITTAGLGVALAPLTAAPRSGAGSAPRPGASAAQDPAVNVVAPGPSLPAGQPAPATQGPVTPVLVSEPARQPSFPVAPPPAEREQIVSVLAATQSPGRPLTGSGPSQGSISTASAGGPDSGPRPVAGGDRSTSSTSPPSPAGASGSSGSDEGPPPLAASSSSAGQPPARAADAGPVPPPQGMQSASGGGPPK